MILAGHTSSCELTVEGEEGLGGYRRDGLLLDVHTKPSPHMHESSSYRPMPGLAGKEKRALELR